MADVPYPYITERNLTLGFDQILYYINEVTNSWASNMIIIGIFIVIMFGVYNRNARGDYLEAFAISGFVTFIVSILFWVAGFVSWVTIGMTFTIMVVGFVGLLFEKRK